MTRKPRLKPCPFCGGPAFCVRTGPIDIHDDEYHQIECMKCRASSFEQMGPMENAARMWNQRARVK